MVLPDQNYRPTDFGECESKAKKRFSDYLYKQKDYKSGKRIHQQLIYT
jgi:hypothetical protein